MFAIRQCNKLLSTFQIYKSIFRWVSETWGSSLNQIVFPEGVSLPNVKLLKKLSKYLAESELEVSIITPSILSYLAVVILKLAEWESPSMSDYSQDGHVVIVAIECYLRLLGIPRASAYNAFHPTLFHQSIRILKQILLLKVPVSNRK